MKKVKNKINKPVDENVNQTINKIDKKLSEKIKKEKWYINFKKTIIKEEAEFSRRAKRSRNVIAVLAFLCFFAVFLSTSFIDYSRAYKTNTAPYFALELRDKYKQATVYYGPFYKAWECDNGEKAIQFGSFGSDINNCKIIVNYDSKGYYTNPNGIKISEKQIDTIKLYYYDKFNNFESKLELDDAYKLSKALNEVWWVQNNSTILLKDGTTSNIAIFNSIIEKSGKYFWELQYDNSEFFKCVKNLNGLYVFSDYDSKNNVCGTDWEPLKLSKDVCKLVDDSPTIIRDVVEITELCE